MNSTMRDGDSSSVSIEEKVLYLDDCEIELVETTIKSTRASLCELDQRLFEKEEFIEELDEAARLIGRDIVKSLATRLHPASEHIFERVWASLDLERSKRNGKIVITEGRFKGKTAKELAALNKFLKDLANLLETHNARLAPVFGSGGGAGGFDSETDLDLYIIDADGSRYKQTLPLDGTVFVAPKALEKLAQDLKDELEKWQK